ncbi:hypothetical protein [Paenibacillus nasutitermitis]|uniref:Uncharacterized protein n=1 Tax=Paenibacillus nasutitermitis TaxID=1652958 RepID=A0A917DNN3_9BACL|nr:hypothetical protein [Paenibacillus nasutitermitis]GGD55457.1 hypothetical protein GCM10010911_11440 [Paenibacillus nasutitermitis]
MKRDEYKIAFHSIKPDTGMQQRLEQGLLHQKPVQTRSNRRFTYIAACLLVLICAGIAAPEVWKITNRSSSTVMQPAGPGNTGAVTPPIKGQADPHPITIPAMKLPDTSSESADMVGLVVYNGNIYTQTSTRIEPEAAKQLLDEKLGRTKAGIDEWSNQTDYTELASTIGETDIYSVKGYDSGFRIMSYQVVEGEIYAELYEHLNGITVTKGEDLIGKTNLLGHVESAKWQSYDSWNYSKPEFNKLQTGPALQTFLEALYEASPVDADFLYKAGIYDNGEEKQKVLYLKLEDQTEITLWLFKGNYVKYSSAPVFFQMKPDPFLAFWDSLQP